MQKKQTSGKKKKPFDRSKTGSLRIIGGKWRGRRFQFPSVEGLRPTADRVRETLFNWLALRISNARCLDMFSGSGALGLESLSRGATHCDFIEQQTLAARAIEQHLKLLSANDQSRVITDDALKFKGGKEGPYDIVFVDPPFSQELSDLALQHLQEKFLLTKSTVIYLEIDRSQALPTTITAFEILKDKTTGNIRFLLLTPAKSCINVC